MAVRMANGCKERETEMTDLKNAKEEVMQATSFMSKMTGSANKAGYLVIGAHIAVSLVYVLYVGNGSPVVSLLFGTVLVALSGAAIAESEWPENKLSLLGVLGFVSMAFSYSVLLAGFGPLFKSDLESAFGGKRYICEHKTFDDSNLQTVVSQHGELALPKAHPLNKYLPDGSAVPVVKEALAICGAKDSRLSAEDLVHMMLYNFISTVAMDPTLSSREEIRAKLKEGISDNISDCGYPAEECRDSGHQALENHATGNGGAGGCRAATPRGRDRG